MQEIENKENSVLFEFLSKVLENEDFQQDKNMTRFCLVEDIKILVSFYKIYKQDGKVVILKVANELINRKDKIQAHRTTESLRSRFRYYHSKLDRNRLLNLIDFYFYLVQENERQNRANKRYTQHYGLLYKSQSLLEFDKSKSEFCIQFIDFNKRQKKYEFKTYSSKQQIDLINQIPIVTKKILDSSYETDWQQEDFRDDSQMKKIEDDIEDVEQVQSQQAGGKLGENKWQLITPSSSENSSSGKRNSFPIPNTKKFQKDVLQKLKEDEDFFQEPVQISQNNKKNIPNYNLKEKQRNSQSQHINKEQYFEEKQETSIKTERQPFKNIVKQIKSNENNSQNNDIHSQEFLLKQENNKNFLDNMRNSEQRGGFHLPSFGQDHNQNYFQKIQDPQQKYKMNQQYQNYSQNFYFNPLDANNQFEFSNQYPQNFNREAAQNNNSLKRKISPQFYKKQYNSAEEDNCDEDENEQSLDDLSEDSSLELVQLILKKNILYKMKEHYKDVLIPGGQVQSENQKTINYILANQQPSNKLFQELDQELKTYQIEQTKQEKWDNLIQYLKEEFNLSYEIIISIFDICNWDTKLILSYLQDPQIKVKDLIWEFQEDEQLTKEKEIKENYQGSKSVEEQNHRKSFLKKLIQQKQNLAEKQN